ncbi:M28 family peptidase [Candidatus Omnitrophota bacterium]
MKTIFHLSIFGLIVVIILTSSFGWRFWSKSFMSTEKEDILLVEKLKGHVYKLSHDIGDRSVFEYEKLKQAEQYIARQFTSFGYKIEFQDYAVYNKTVRNIIAIKEGTARPEEIIILGAHYDTCFNPGADDNASGVAVLLELARNLSGISLNRTLKFIAFTNEEPPFFKTEDMGSMVYVREARKRKEDIKASLVFESVGYYTDNPNSQQYPLLFGLFYPNKGNFIAIAGNFSSRWLVKRVVTSFKSKTQFPIESVVTFSFVPGVDFSDNWSFWEGDYPSIMITDTAFYRNPGYHGVLDTYEKLDYKGMGELVKGFSAVSIGLAK